MPKKIFLLIFLMLIGCGPARDDPQALQELAENAQRVADAQEIYFHNAPGTMPHYAANLEELQSFNPDLKPAPEITFLFGRADASGYSFTAQSAKVKTAWLCREEESCRPIQP